MTIMDVYNDRIRGSNNAMVDIGGKPLLVPIKSSLFSFVMYYEDNEEWIQMNKHDDELVGVVFDLLNISAMKEIIPRQMSLV